MVIKDLLLRKSVLSEIVIIINKYLFMVSTEQSNKASCIVLEEKQKHVTSKKTVQTEGTQECSRTITKERKKRING